MKRECPNQNFRFGGNGGKVIQPLQNKKQSGQSLGLNLKAVDWDKEKLEPFKKNFYLKEQVLRSKENVKEYRDRHQIILKNDFAVPNPFITFQEAYLPKYILEEIKAANFTWPTPIQAQTWPVLLAGFDLIGIAQTGSGKTLAFIIPSIIHLNDQPPVKENEGPICLVLAPTRELAMQILQEGLKFGLSSQIKIVSIYGGVDKGTQIRQIRKGMDILVATPGRLIDFLESNVISLKRVTYLVLDEADRMLDMGFEPQIRKILSQIRPDKQCSLWTATWPKQVKQLARDFIKNPVHIQIGHEELTMNKDIQQFIELLPESVKLDRIQQIFEKKIEKKQKTLIFCQTKRQCDSLSRELLGRGIRNICIHGDKKQDQRDYAMNKFKHDINVMVATDLAARGLDIRDIRFVINFDFPIQVEDYIHRIGRTGRAGDKGIAYTFFSKENERLLYDFMQLLRTSNAKIPQALFNLEFIKKKNRYMDTSNIYIDEFNRIQQEDGYPPMPKEKFDFKFDVPNEEWRSSGGGGWDENEFKGFGSGSFNNNNPNHNQQLQKPQEQIPTNKQGSWFDQLQNV